MGREVAAMMLISRWTALRSRFLGRDASKESIEEEEEEEEGLSVGREADGAFLILTLGAECCL